MEASDCQIVTLCTFLIGPVDKYLNILTALKFGGDKIIGG
jgi:hypothetical protein